MATTRYGCHRNYRLPPELVAELRVIAERNDLTESEVLRRLLGEMVKQVNARDGKCIPSERDCEYKSPVD